MDEGMKDDYSPKEIECFQNAVKNIENFIVSKHEDPFRFTFEFEKTIQEYFNRKLYLNLEDIKKSLLIYNTEITKKSF